MSIPSQEIQRLYILALKQKKRLKVLAKWGANSYRIMAVDEYVELEGGDQVPTFVMLRPVNER